MKIYSYDNEGYLTGESTLDDSDKCPITDTWLIPARATEKVPPVEKDGYKIKFKNEFWEYEKILTDEQRKINGETLLEEGETIENEKLIKIESPGSFYRWDFALREWRLDKELVKKDIYKKLDEIDKLSVRPLRAKFSGKATTDDEEKLLELEEAVIKLRLDLQKL